jgi:hypothetical protein
MNTQITAIAILAILTLSARAQVEIPDAPQWEVTIHVVDETGSSLSSATAFASYYVPPPANATEAGSRKEAVTDTNGFVTLSAHSGPVVICGANKAGYYQSSGLSFEFKSKTNDRWQPWNPTETLLLKRIVKPIPMYARSIRSGPPAFNKPVGYDMGKGDWVAPYGKGESTDIVFTGNLDQKSKKEFDFKLAVSFPNPGDGLQPFSVPETEKYSGLRSPHQAPEVGYLPEIVRNMSRHPGKGTKNDMNDPSRNYFFRVRTLLDAKGGVKSALYGKIYGDFMQFTYYLNPTSNDRNVEFDPKQNLLKGLKSFEQVSAP